MKNTTDELKNSLAYQNGLKELIAIIEQYGEDGVVMSSGDEDVHYTVTELLLMGNGYIEHCRKYGEDHLVKEMRQANEGEDYISALDGFMRELAGCILSVHEDTRVSLN